MMPKLKDLGLQIVAPLHHLRFRPHFGITGENERNIAVYEPHRNRTVIKTARYHGRMQDFQASGADLVPFTCPRFVITSFRIEDGIKCSLESPGGVGVARHPHLVYGKGFKDLGKLANMVGMRMRADEQVN